jgi:hypothetical protein
LRQAIYAIWGNNETVYKRATMNKVETEDVIRAVEAIMEFCQEKGISELLAYMAMIHLTGAMECQLGFGSKRKTDS